MSEGQGAAELVHLLARADELAAALDFGDEGEQVYRRIVELAPEDTLACTRLARCLLNKDEREAAEALYRRVLELKPDNLIAWNFVTDLKLTRQAKVKGDVDAAAAAKAASKVGPSSPISAGDMVVLKAACTGIPEPEGEYLESNFMANVLTTVLELQMHAKTVFKSI
ncbi:MAG: tetratricopeptide repeat protein, partial [Candidatus Dormibacteria bacterium]